MPQPALGERGSDLVVLRQPAVPAATVTVLASKTAIVDSEMRRCGAGLEPSNHDAYEARDSFEAQTQARDPSET